MHLLLHLKHRISRDNGFQQESKEKLEGKNPHAVALGRLGGKKGGKARLKKLSPERRKEIARKAAKARWGSTESRKQG